MQSVVPSNTENISGLQYIEFIPVGDIVTMNRPYAEKITAAPTLEAGKDWYKMAFTMQTPAFNSVKEGSADGAVHKVAISGIIPKLQYDFHNTLAEMQDDLFIVKVYDNNGNLRIAGTLDFPLRFNYSETTKDAFGQRTEYAVTFSRDLKEAVPYLIL